MSFYDGDVMPQAEREVAADLDQFIIRACMALRIKRGARVGADFRLDEATTTRLRELAHDVRESYLPYAEGDLLCEEGPRKWRSLDPSVPAGQAAVEYLAIADREAEEGRLRSAYAAVYEIERKLETVPAH